MNILAISHSCVTDVNQKLFVALNDIPTAHVELLIPREWRSDYTGKLFDSMTLNGVDFPIHKFPIALPGNITLHFYTKLPQLSDLKAKPDIILSTEEPYSLSGFQAMVLAKRFHVPFVFQTNQNIPKKYPFPFNWIEAKHFRDAAYGLAYSEEARQVMLKKGLRGKSDVVPYATDVSMFTPGTSPDLRQKLGLGEHKVLGYMGRLVPEKGLDTLLQAAKILRENPETVRFKILFVGSGAEESSLRELSALLGLTDLVVFAGAVPHTNAGEYMQCMDMFVLASRTLPNWKEQFGRVIIEAMSCGIPVIGSNSGAIPVLISDTGGGMVFKEGDANDCAAKISTLLENDSKSAELGQLGRQAVNQKYSLSAVAAKLTEILKASSKQITLA